MPEILFIFKTVYGVDRLYPGDALAEKFCRLIGKKTFTADDLANIRDLGFATRVIGYVPA